MVSIRLVMNGGIINKANRGVEAYLDGEIQEKIKTAYGEYRVSMYQSPVSMETALANSGLTAPDTTVTGDGPWEIAVGSRNFRLNTDGTIDKLESSSGQQESGNGGSENQEFSVVNLPTATPGTAVSTNSKYTSDNKTAVIPAGYTVSSTSTEQSIDNGLVITKDSNEWVWIPVSSSDLAVMYTEDTTGWEMSPVTRTETYYETVGSDELERERTIEGSGVITKYKSNGNIISGKIRVNPGDTSDYKEPDVLNNNNYDKKATNYTIAGFSSYVDMATKLRDDYKAMIDSVKKYGGFYIGRYELSNAGTQKNQSSLTDTNWYNLYAKCKTLGSDSTESRMIWGCQWDLMCKFINTLGDQVNLADSRIYGNYYNSQTPANVSGYGKFQVTGYSEYWKANNIYDIAGNCSEWTQEAYQSGGRAYRGGVFYYGGADNPVSYRNYDDPTRNICSSRPTLYIK